MNERQACTLFAIIDEYVQTAQPVASKIIVSKYDLGVSPATVRNDMAALEQAGYLRQPHTSSGRVPTERGYRLYLQQMRRPAGRNVCVQLRKAADRSVDQQGLMRELAKTLVQLSGETALMSLDSEWNKVTGVSNLFEKPDFDDVDMLRSLSRLVDKFEEVMKGIFDEIDQDVRVYLGTENPFGQQMATILVKYTLPNGATGVFGLTGPLRMNYKKNIQLLKEAKYLIEGKRYGKAE